MHTTHTPSSITYNPAAEMHAFSSKERDTETGLSYFGARYYSSDLCIWQSVDPMSDKYPSLSPYTYCANNPIKLVDPNGEEIDGYEGSNGQYKWFEDHTEQNFTDDNNVTWTKITDKKSDWNEAMTIRNANIKGLCSLGFDKDQVKKDVRLFDGNSDLFTKLSKLDNADKYTSSWKGGERNSGGKDAFKSPEVKNTGYALKYYPTKNGEKGALGIIKNNGFLHMFEGGMEALERKIFSQKANNDPVYDMHYNNARGLLKGLHKK